jgi:hypothetical protein
MSAHEIAFCLQTLCSLCLFALNAKRFFHVSRIDTLGVFQILDADRRLCLDGFALLFCRYFP